MVIRELYVKSFGKFTEEHFYLKEGVQVICGENEFGKSTLHAFIRAMLFGLDRGRGRAAQKDEFSRYEPWENPGNYAGVMRFTCGGRNFRLERSFARAARRTALVCEDDGEELSLEQGDLDILLGGITPALFDSTVSVGQLRAEPGQELYEALENRAANYFETGSGEIDISAALRDLRERQRDTERALRGEEAAQEAELEKIRMECGYLERDMRALQEEYEEKQEQLKALDRQKLSGAAGKDGGAEERESGGQARESVSGGRSLIVMGIAGVLAGTVGFLWSLFLKGAAQAVPAAPFTVISGIVSAAGLLLLAAGLTASVRRKRMERNGGGRGRDSAAKRGQDSAAVRAEADRDEKKRLQGELEHIRSAWKEKEIRCGSLREQCGEYGPSDMGVKLVRRQQALSLAEQALRQAAREMGDQTAQLLNRRASEILASVTDGAYRALRMEEGRHLSVWDGIRRIPAERLSRGTIEQIYFSVRLAAADILLEEPMPVILDDAFAFYDSIRLESALKWLSRQGKQVIIFTCHKREEEIVKRVIYS